MDWGQAFTYSHMCRHLRVSLPVLRPQMERKYELYVESC